MTNGILIQFRLSFYANLILKVLIILLNYLINIYVLILIYKCYILLDVKQGVIARTFLEGVIGYTIGILFMTEYATKFYDGRNDNNTTNAVSIKNQELQTNIDRNTNENK